MKSEIRLIPAVLAIALALLVFFPIPVANHDIVLSIVAGLLGALTSRRSATDDDPPPAAPAPPQP